MPDSQRLRHEAGRLLRRESSPMATLRRWYWIFVRRWETEICGHCGRPVARCTDSWWHAPDALWLAVNGQSTGVMCPPCFSKACRRAGYSVSWRATVDYALCGSCERVPEGCLCEVA